jgi:CHAT domain-containing protein/Flp pilus assembly protein TadD
MKILMTSWKLRVGIVLLLLGSGLVLPIQGLLAQPVSPMSIEQAAGLEEAEKLNQTVRELYGQGKYSEAIPLAEKTLAIRKRILGNHHPDVATSLNNLALLYANQGHYKKAELLYLQTLEMQKMALGVRHPDVAVSLNNLAGLYNDQGLYEKAEPLLVQALELRKTVLGDRHPDVAQSLNNLAFLYSTQGRYEKAEPLYLKALDLLKSLLGDRHPYVATSLNNLAELYSTQGRYEKAEPLYLKALEMRKTVLGDRHPDVAQSLNNLAELYRSQGRYEKAEPLYLKALELFKSLLGDHHPYVAANLNNLAGLYRSQGRYEKAEPLYLQALGLRKSLLGDRHPDVAQSLNNLAELYRSQGNYEKAEPLYLEALEMLKTLLGDRHPYVAANLNNLAEMYRSRGNYERAEPLYLEALEMLKKLLGDRHPHLAINFTNLAVLYSNQSRYEKAINFLEQGLNIEENNLETNIAIGAEAQKQDYLKTINQTTDASVWLHLQHANTNPKAANVALTTLLRRKSRILSTLADNLKQIRQNLTTTDKEQIDKLIDTETQISTLYHQGLGKLSPEQYRAELTKLEGIATQLTEALSRRSAEFRTAIQPVTPDAIQAQLPANSALVELVAYQPFNPKAEKGKKWGDHRYAAYILTSTGAIQGIDLGPAEAIDKTIETLRNNLRDKSTPIDIQLKASARALDQRLMQPIRQRLGNTHNLFISPDSDLHLLPFEALVDEQGRYLLQTYNITYLTSGRDLLRLQNPKTNNNKPLVLADPFFDKPGKMTASSATRSINLAETTWNPLDKTSEEAEAIGTLFGIRPFLGSNATETIVKQTTSPSILHLATHGFFQPTTDSTTNPLLNSGLVFAGFRIGKSGNDDGILTALEASNLNLSGTKLVTLSACDTGLGTVATGEGIYGLRRALSISGAESQTISLWKVADDATKDLMVNYYTRLKKGEGRSEALHNAQRDMLKSEKYSHPYFWAAFIPSGDWRPL